MSTPYFVEQKPEMAHAEKGEVGKHGPIDHHIHHSEGEIKHGDRALQLIGDERVELTQEDVS